MDSVSNWFHRQAMLGMGGGVRFKPGRGRSVTASAWAIMA
ncbi:hypothetical protein SAMN05216188_13071 [Lentzea xinjiangensis]|uniref:Uncharacterized protein n=1 Tax=Lentzea xinjiangensis TaxID=402600 RepID=A0A1H9W464_9PSEU|nr:hypothetical protein SAMN05216188_13071 [Lentzea xinjiangensis]